MKIEKETAKRLYESVPDWFKKDLEEAFDKESFRKIDFKDLKTFEDLCKAADTTESEFTAKYKDLPISQTLKTVAKFEILSEAINDGWKPDTLDTNARKWFPYFTVSSSGLAFSDSLSACVNARASVGFPLCFKSEEQSNHAGRQFIKLWEELILRKIS